MISMQHVTVTVATAGLLILAACGELGQGSVGVPSRPGIEPTSVNEDAVKGKAGCSVDPDPVLTGDDYLNLGEGHAAGHDSSLRH